jgi:hypothetical protein
MIPFFFWFFDSASEVEPEAPKTGAGKGSKTKRFYVDDVPYDIPVTEIDYFLKNLPKQEEKEPQKIAIQAIKKTGEVVKAESSIQTPAYEAFKNLVFKQIKIPSFDYKALLEFQQKREAELAVLIALERQAMLAYKDRAKARLYALLLE